MIDARELLSRVESLGFAVTLAGGGPQLSRPHDGAELPPDLMAILKENREAVIDYLANPRAAVIRAVLLRAGKRATYWMTRQWASCELVRKGVVPDEANYLCVEGDDGWTALPEDESP